MPLPCPVCGFLTNNETCYGTYGICAICGWEDDGVQLANPACGGGANEESLIEAQLLALQDHPVGQATCNGFRRDPAWRPMNASEIETATAEKDESYWKNKEILSPNDAYWHRTYAPDA